jgi:hypothetical protein
MDIRYWVQMTVDLASLSIVNSFPNISYLNLLNDTSHLKA